MEKAEHKPENLVREEYLESYDELKKSMKRHQENPDIPILICCNVKEYQEEYGKELASIIKARQRLEDFINRLGPET